MTSVFFLLSLSPQSAKKAFKQATVLFKKSSYTKTYSPTLGITKQAKMVEHVYDYMGWAVQSRF